MLKDISNRVTRLYHNLLWSNTLCSDSDPVNNLSTLATFLLHGVFSLDVMALQTLRCRLIRRSFAPNFAGLKFH